jgi:amidohydrolase
MVGRSPIMLRFGARFASSPYVRLYPGTMHFPLPEDFIARVKAFDDEMIAFRRDLHAHPELAHAEARTTRVLRERLEAAWLRPTVLPSGTGLVCDIGRGDTAIALRADLDALPVVDEKSVPYRSTVPGACHACGHDVHTAVVLGAGLVLADLEAAGELPGRVRLLFQPAEEVMPGGALDVIRAGGIDGVSRVLALHCDPRAEVGEIGLRVGPITGASDQVDVRLQGPGGHTARPHLTADLVYALAKVATETVAALSRRVDPRAGLSLVWGRVAAGSAPNAIPQSGELSGTLRCLDPQVWETAPQIVEELVLGLASQYGVTADVHVQRGVPPCVNDVASVRLFREAALAAIGPEAVLSTEQSLGGEDFAWYLEHTPGALARLGVRAPGETVQRDLHQGRFDIDERAISVGIRLLVATTLLALGE